MLKTNLNSLKIVFTILLFICIVSSLVLRDYIIPKRFDDLLGTNDKNITKVFMRDGSNGNSVSTNDRVKIEELLAVLNNLLYRKSFNQQRRTGYSYFYEFYIGNKAVLRITGSGKNVDINGIYYELNQAISKNELREWFNSLPIEASK